jgi:hypothetical protein
MHDYTAAQLARITCPVALNLAKDDLMTALVNYPSAVAIVIWFISLLIYKFPASDRA